MEIKIICTDSITQPQLDNATTACLMSFWLPFYSIWVRTRHSFTRFVIIST